MLLFHGTSRSAGHQAIKHGLSPRALRKDGGHNSNWPDQPSSDDCIYLTDAYPIFYGNVSASMKKDSHACFLVIDTEKLVFDRFAADEDVVEQAMRMTPDKDPLADEGGDMHERTSAFREMLLALVDFGYDRDWSLKMMGSCSYHGEIPSSAIVGLVEWEASGPMMLLCDASMTLMNYQIMGSYYRRLSRALAGLPEIEPASQMDAIFVSPDKVMPYVCYIENKSYLN